MSQKAKAKSIAVFAALIAAAAVASFFYSQPSRDSNAPKSDSSVPLVGEILSVDGEALFRPPRQNGTQMYPLAAGPLTADTLIQTTSASTLVIEFRPGPTIRLRENSRLIAEVDPSVPNSIQATLLSGDIDVQNPGSNSAFTLLKNGEALDYSKGQIARMVPLIQLGSENPGTAEPDEKTEARIEENMRIERETELASAPTVDIGASPAQPISASTPSSIGKPQTATPVPNSIRDESETYDSKLLSTLTNDDIRTQLRAQAGGFQKCFVAMVNRRSEGGSAMSALPRGQIRVAFKIKPSGKVEDARVLSSPFQDTTFDRCVGEALGRVLFRSFKGATIPVSEFPIILE